MGIAKRHLNWQSADLVFDKNKLAEELEKKLPHVIFALLMGSAVDGVVKKGSDIDLAFWLEGKPELSFYSGVARIVEKCVPGPFCDIGVLNKAEPVYRFEALKGELLFTVDYEKYLDFYSRTCREYESQMASYERQMKYRLEAMDHAV